MATNRDTYPPVKPIWISQAMCDRLNGNVCDLFFSGEEKDARDAIERVIHTERMRLIEGDDTSPVDLYQMPSGELVTVWWESDFGTSIDLTTLEEWEHAAVGFDVDTGLRWKVFEDDDAA